MCYKIYLNVKVEEIPVFDLVADTGMRAVA